MPVPQESLRVLQERASKRAESIAELFGPTSDIEHCRFMARGYGEAIEQDQVDRLFSAKLGAPYVFEDLLGSPMNVSRRKLLSPAVLSDIRTTLKMATILSLIAIAAFAVLAFI